MRFIEYVILGIASAAFVYFVRWTWYDVRREKRPTVTNEMLDQAYIDMLEHAGYVIEDDDDLQIGDNI